MYSDGIDNQFEYAHQKGLKRGFDLGWSYKGRFDRTLLRDLVSSLDPIEDSVQIKHLTQAIDLLKNNENNQEFITDL